jgi:isopenicillin-N epimerase
MTFGRAMLSEWLLDPDVTYLNHGTVGAPPRRVLLAQQKIRDEIERQPSEFLLRDLAPMDLGRSERPEPLLRTAARHVARFVHARETDLAFVENATTGANAVLRSIDLREGDEIAVTQFGYGGVTRAARYAARSAGASVREVAMPYPVEHPDAVVKAIDEAITPRTRLVVVDHVTSETALILPVRDIAERCRARGVLVLVDGAHGPGAVPVDLGSLGVDWYAANLHKWALTPRPCGFLWARDGRQSDIHPPVVTWGLDLGFTTEFDWASTRDPSAFLAAPEGIAFLEQWGPGVVPSHNHALAWEAGKRLASAWDVDQTAREDMTGTMITIQLPAEAGSTKDDARVLRDALLFEDRIEIQLHALRGRLWVRLSAQIYNEMEDVDRLARAVRARVGAGSRS